MQRQVIRLRWFFTLFALFVFLLMVGAAPAQPNAGVPSNRYLLIVETSRPMQRRTAGLFQTVQDLLGSSLAKQWRKGDTLGLWTFNEDLYAGKFPLQDCSPENKAAVIGRVTGFLKDQKYENQPNLGKVLPQVERVVQGSRYITVILISTGTDEIHGTPFDAQINQAFKLWRGQQQDARMPLVTVLRAKAGQIADYAVNQAPWPVELPPLPAELQGDNRATNAVAPSTPAIVGPLVFSGNKPQSKPNPAIALPSQKSASPIPPTSVDGVKSAAPTPTATLPAAALSALAPGQTPTPQMSTPAPPPVQTPAVPQPLDSRPAVSNVPDHAKMKPPQGQPTTPAVNSDAKPENPSIAQAPAPRVNSPAASAPASNQTGLQAPVAVVAPKRKNFDGTTLLIVGLSLVVTFSVIFWLVIRARTRAPLHISLITQSLDRKK